MSSENSERLEGGTRKIANALLGIANRDVELSDLAMTELKRLDFDTCEALYCFLDGFRQFKKVETEKQFLELMQEAVCCARWSADSSHIDEIPEQERRGELTWQEMRDLLEMAIHIARGAISEDKRSQLLRRM